MSNGMNLPSMADENVTWNELGEALRIFTADIAKSMTATPEERESFVVNMRRLRQERISNFIDEATSGTAELAHDRRLFGVSFEDARGMRIDPRNVEPAAGGEVGPYDAHDELAATHAAARDRLAKELEAVQAKFEVASSNWSECEAELAGQEQELGRLRGFATWVDREADDTRRSLASFAFEARLRARTALGISDGH